MIKVFFVFFLSAFLAEAQTVDQTELQWVLCEPSAEQLFAKIKPRAGAPKEREVYYTETRDLGLLNLGGVLRTRVEGANAKTAAKVRFVDPSQIPWDFLNGKDFKCEVDAYMTNEKISCSLNYKTKKPAPPISKEQELFLRNETGFQRFAELKILGPAHSTEWEWDEPAIQEAVTVEAVSIETRNKRPAFYSLELSVHTLLSKKDQTTRKVREWLLKNKVILCPQQNGKTEPLLRVLLGL